MINIDVKRPSEFIFLISETMITQPTLTLKFLEEY